mgnify:CR=1 FL=1
MVLARDHNHGVDYWSLGILVYEILTRSTPFEHENAVSSCLICNVLMDYSFLSLDIILCILYALCIVVYDLSEHYRLTRNAKGSVC